MTRKLEGDKGRKEVFIYSTVCYVYTELMGLSHIFKNDERIPCTLMRIDHLFACRCACVCARVSVSGHAVLAVGVLCACVGKRECAHACVWGGDFTFLRSVVYQTNLLRALAG